jgi:hypothetical protein
MIKWFTKVVYFFKLFSKKWTHDNDRRFKYKTFMKPKSNLGLGEKI